MTEAAFETIREGLGRFAFTSLTYTEYGEIQDAAEIPAADAVLLTVEDPDRENTVKLFWAADSPEPLLRVASGISRAIYTEFVPDSFVEPLAGAGFEPESLFQDYFRRNLDGVPETLPKGTEFLEMENAEEASALTMECRWRSRGFHGETPAFFREWLAEPENAVLGLRDEGRLAGIICLSTYGSRRGRMLWLREIAVRPAFQNRGYGRKLIEAGFRWRKDRGAVRAFLAADALNAAAIHLYESCGFVLDGESGQRNMLRPEKENFSYGNG